MIRLWRFLIIQLISKFSMKNSWNLKFNKIFLSSLLAFGADFSRSADGHLVCIQNIDSGTSESLSYSTQAINIQGQNRIRTGASFLILNGALKASSGLKAKCSIVEDGLMIQISSTKMQSVRDALRNMKDVEIACGPLDEVQKEAEETVSIEWVADDMSFNVGVSSPIDSTSLEGKESIRTRLDFTSPKHTKMLRWSEVFLLETDDNVGHLNDDHLNYSKLGESIARASGSALLPFLDLMAGSQLKRIGIRVTLGENVSNLFDDSGVSKGRVKRWIFIPNHMPGYATFWQFWKKILRFFWIHKIIQKKFQTLQKYFFKNFESTNLKNVSY